MTAYLNHLLPLPYTVTISVPPSTVTSRSASASARSLGAYPESVWPCPSEQTGRAACINH